MKVSAKECSHEVREAMRGGDGFAILDMVPGDKLPAHVRLSAILTLKPGCSIGSHAHEEETEIFTFVSGCGEASDDGVLTQVSAGDVLLTGGGATHSVRNTGEADLVFTAVIVTQQ